MNRRTLPFLLLLLALSACRIDGLQLQMSEGWRYRSIAAWKHADPAQIALSGDGRWLYIATERAASSFASSLIAVNMRHGRQHVLLYGLNRAHALALAPDGALWLGEAFDHGLIWRITDPAHFPEEQQVDRLHLLSDSPNLAPFVAAGEFHHASLTFDRAGRYAYLADGREGGCLYRLRLATRSLQAWHDTYGWVEIRHPDDAAIEARALGAHPFANIQGMTRSADGAILLAEYGSGNILRLLDHEKQPSLQQAIRQPELTHPQSLAWDERRHLLWITDDHQHGGRLWIWDGRSLLEVARHEDGRIHNVHSSQGRIFVSVRRLQRAPEAVVEILEHDSHD